MSERIRVLIPDGNDVLATPVARCLRAVEEIDVWMLVDDPPISGWRTRRKTGFIRMGAGAWVDEVLAAIQETQATVLLPVSCPGIWQVMNHKAAFAGKVHCARMPDAQTLQRAGNKAALAEFTAQAGIATPKSWVVYPQNSKTLPRQEMRYPVLAKPATGTGGAGIEILNSPADLERFLVAPPHDGCYVIQEFLRGSDVGCSVLCEDGEVLVYTIQRCSKARAQRFGSAMKLDFVHDRSVLSVVEETMRALRFDGVAHCDLLYDEAAGDVKLLEINPRFWGSVIASKVAGINFPEMAVRLALNKAIRNAHFRDCRYYSTAGTIKTILKSPWHVIALPRLLWKSDLWIRAGDPLPELLGLRNRVKWRG
jgi:predicted ATP-grasp superfamily ATP-dependent carboligase